MTVENSILIKKEEYVATITINRPFIMNALNKAAEFSILEALNQYGMDKDVRVIVLEGAGGNFSVGGDLADLGSDIGAPEWYDWLNEIAFKLIKTMRSIPQPIICKVKGNAYGYGMSVALAGDFVIAAHNAKFCVPFVNVGLTLDGGASYFLPRLVGYAQARRLSFLGEVVSGRDAVEMGLIYKSVEEKDVDAEVAALAQTLAKKPSPRAMSAIKEALEASFAKDLQETVEWEASRQAIIFQSKETKETIQKIIAKSQRKN